MRPPPAPHRSSRRAPSGRGRMPSRVVLRPDPLFADPPSHEPLRPDDPRPVRSDPCRLARRTRPVPQPREPAPARLLGDRADVGGDRRRGVVRGLGRVLRGVVVAGRRHPRRRRDRDSPRPAQRRLRRLGQRARRGVARLRVLGHPVRDDVVERHGQVRPLLRGPRRLPHEVRVHHRRQALRLERPVPEQALHEHAGQGVDVDALVPVVAGEPLGGHVARAAHAERRAADGGAVERAGDAEVGEVRDPALGLLGPDEQHVGRLHVAVHERLGVRGVERVGHLGDHVHGARGGQRAALDEVGEVAAVDEAHVDEELAVDLAVVVDRDDVRVGELRRQRRLALEPAAVLLVGGQLPQEALQRDEPLTARVVGAVDLAHATAPDQGVEPVGPEDLRLHRGQHYGARHRHRRRVPADHPHPPVAARRDRHRAAAHLDGGPDVQGDGVDDPHGARVGIGDVEVRAVGRERHRGAAHPHRRDDRAARGVDHRDLVRARHPRPARIGDDGRGRRADGHGRDGRERGRVDQHHVVGTGVGHVEQPPVGAGREPGRLRADRDGRRVGRVDHGDGAVARVGHVQPVAERDRTREPAGRDRARRVQLRVKHRDAADARPRDVQGAVRAEHDARRGRRGGRRWSRRGSRCRSPRASPPPGW